MSDDNQTETTETTETTAEQPGQASAPSEAAPETSGKDKALDLGAKVLALRTENPKVFYGGVGAFVVVLLVLIFSGGDNKGKLEHIDISRLTAGQRYELRSPNSSVASATVRLVSVPGSTEAYDDTEEDDRVGNCKHLPQGTPVEVLGFQDAYGKAKTFSQVKILEGECQGHTSWTLSINVR
ncbi:MAG: hypothetical protein RQ715_05935 [Methylococcales bacterium]|nr:hypothetical protein [Methylococcales bacterium]